MMQYFCLDFWWNVGDGGKLVSTAWSKFSPCCSHLMIETYCKVHVNSKLSGKNFYWSAAISKVLEVDGILYLAQINCHPEIPWEYPGVLEVCAVSSWVHILSIAGCYQDVDSECSDSVWNEFQSCFKIWCKCIRFSHETYEQHQPPYDGLLTGKGEPTLQWNIISCKGYFLENLYKPSI